MKHGRNTDKDWPTQENPWPALSVGIFRLFLQNTGNSPGGRHRTRNPLACTKLDTRATFQTTTSGGDKIQNHSHGWRGKPLAIRNYSVFPPWLRFHGFSPFLAPFTAL